MTMTDKNLQLADVELAIDNDKVVLTSDEAAKLIGVAPAMIRRLVKEDPTFPHFYSGKRRVRIPKNAFIAWINKYSNEPWDTKAK